MKRLLPAVLLFVSVAGVAGEFSVTKSMAPGPVTMPGIKAISVFNVRGTDYPRGAMMVSALHSVGWSTTMFPNSTGVQSEICLVTYGRSECKLIASSSTGEAFFDSIFRYPSMIVIKHQAKGGARNSKPIGQDSVTINLKY